MHAKKHAKYSNEITTDVAKEVISALRMNQVVRLDTMRVDEDAETGISLFLAAPEPPEDINEMVGTDIFLSLQPGPERICTVLLADGFRYPSVAMITGMTETQIEQIMKNIRQRLTRKA